MRGTRYLSAWRQTVSDWGSTPATESNRAIAPSSTRSERSTSTVKSTWPGVQERAQMSATAPGTASEYSRGSGGSLGGVPVPPGLRVALWLAAIAGPILLVVADFTTLFEARGQGYLKDISGHANHSYAM